MFLMFIATQYIIDNMEVPGMEGNEQKREIERERERERERGREKRARHKRIRGCCVNYVVENWMHSYSDEVGNLVHLSNPARAVRKKCTIYYRRRMNCHFTHFVLSVNFPRAMLPCRHNNITTQYVCNYVGLFGKWGSI